MREILEETGLTIIEAQQLITLLAIFPYKGSLFRHIGIIYSVKIKSEEKLKTESDGKDSEGALWHSCSDIHPTNCAPLVIQLRERNLI